MKIRFIITVAFLISAVFTGLAYSIDADPFLVKVPNGSINWTSGIITATGSGKPAENEVANSPDLEAKIFSAAMENAGQNLFEIVKKIRINSIKRVENLFFGDSDILIKAREMVYATREVEKKRKTGPDGVLEVHLRFQFYGGFAQLVLPQEIKQVESITKVLSGKKVPSEGPAQEIFSGLVVDARGIGARPAMAPMILDENGQVVYGAAFVSREYAIQNGMSGYVTDIGAAERETRIGYYPLTVKGLKTEGPGRCDIVISNSDAAKLRKSSENLLFLKECRVVIVLDAES